MERIEAIERLAKLRADGLLSEEEFQREKERLLTAPADTPTAAPLPPHAPGESKPWADVPLHEKYWLHAVLILLVIPVGIIMLLANPSYRKRNDEAVRVGKGFKAALIALSTLVWLFGLARLIASQDSPTQTSFDESSVSQPSARATRPVTPTAQPPAATSAAQASRSITWVRELVGLHPGEATEVRELSEALRQILGANHQLFLDSLSIGSEVVQEGQYVIGRGCVPHMCGSSSAVYVIEVASAKVYAALQQDDQIVGVWGPDNNLPAPLQQWITERGGSITTDRATSAPPPPQEQTPTTGASGSLCELPEIRNAVKQAIWDQLVLSSGRGMDFSDLLASFAPDNSPLSEVITRKFRDQGSFENVQVCAADNGRMLTTVVYYKNGRLGGVTWNFGIPGGAVTFGEPIE